MSGLPISTPTKILKITAKDGVRVPEDTEAGLSRAHGKKMIVVKKFQIVRNNA
jgi:hypothetical protein